MPAKKYKLFKSDGANGEKPPCAFFFSAQGCRNGDNCKFSHKRPSEDEQEEKCHVTVHEDSSDVVSSESEDETPPKQQQKKKKKKKNAPASSDSKQNATPTSTPNKQHKTPTPKAKHSNSTPNQSNKKRKRDNSEVNANDLDSGLGMFCKPKRSKETKQVNSDTPNSKQKSTPKSTTPKSTTPKKTKKTEPSVPSFRALNLPIAGFNTETGNVVTPQRSQIQKDVETSPTETEYPIPKSTPEGLTWQKAVINTRSNPIYKSVYDFDKWKTQDEENGVTKKEEWFKARPFGAWCAKNPHAIAIDCEMCETKDPISGKSDHKALCRLSVVNAVNPDDVLIDTLVKPVWPVVDYRSRINGIKKENLDSVEFTLEHAKAFMKALCSEETVIIGHALHNDLAAIKMEHHCNVDSALLFKSSDPETRTCSLKDLAKSVTGKEMPNIHCSVNDARTAFICLRDGYLKKDYKPDPVEKSAKPPREVSEATKQLFLHRIPKGCTTDHVRNMILSYTSIVADNVPDIEFGGSTGKTTVTFTSSGHANLAFRTFEGEPKPDKTGRLQKRIYLRNGDYICVRKMK